MDLTSQDFKEQTVIVTGAGYGIGRQIALAFGRGGANVVLAARSRDKLEGVAEELRGMGTRPLVADLDVSEEAQCRAVVEQAMSTYGRLDVLVNNAGIAGPTALARDVSGGDWRECLAVNLDGAFYCAKYASAPMIEAGGGAMVNIASVAGRIGFPMRTPYAASKWGMIGLSHSLAAELGPHGVRVNCICPGATEGERITRVISARAEAKGRSAEEERAEQVAGIALRRMATEPEVASAVMWLCSPGASGITGQCFNVDAGQRMQ